MKIAVDLVRIRQEWSPDTGAYSSWVILLIGGTEIEVPVTEEQLPLLIQAASPFHGNDESRSYGDPAGTYADPSGTFISPSDVPLLDEAEDRIFGGDLAKPPDVEEEHEELRVDSEQIRQQMRARAARKMGRTLPVSEVDEAGNPIVKPIPVVSRTIVAGDEDGFAQG